MPDALGDGMDRAEKDLDMPGRGEDSGKDFTKGVGDGVDDESRRRNPFSKLLDSFKGMFPKFGDATREELPDIIDTSFKDATADVDVGDQGVDVGGLFAKGIRKGVQTETKKKNPFKSLFTTFTGTLQKFVSSGGGMPGGAFGWATALGLPGIGGIAKLIAGYAGGIVAVLGNV